ncbi:hypothetical protein NHX12_007847 [Muraenolepis orangiensis]|uniref:DH domain-containing protein n=1 Tax=Muraenolepis orangiensis TaxID=630683 RepID=A0A9Q0IBY4_9TELE|nr:hypothetical protein NHX12_007847 [Muraenolepis orangiensis]
MPDVKSPPPCDYPLASSVPTGSPSRCASFFGQAMDVEPCLPDLPLSPGALPPFPQHGHAVAAPYPGGLQGAPFSFMSRCNSSTLLSSLELQHCSGRQGASGVGPGKEACCCIHTDGCGGGGGRPYRSMENLNWNSVADPGMYALAGGPYRSMESEFVFHCTETSHWYDGPPDGAGMGVYGLMPSPDSLAFYPRRGLPRKDLALFPQWLWEERDGRKGLREKLRLQSARSTAEPSKHLPLRPQVTPGTPYTQGSPYLRPAAAGAKPLCAVRLTSPEEIKQEVLRRLQLRRQNSSPDLALHSSPESPTVLKSSRTTDNVAGHGSERPRLPAGRLHIPTFEEFKRMRKSADGQGSPEYTAAASQEAGRVQAPRAGSHGKTDACALCGSGSAGRPEGDGTEGADGRAEMTCDGDVTASSLEGGPQTAGRRGSVTTAPGSSPIRTGPAPRTPLQPLADSAPEKGPVALRGQGARRSSLEGAGGRAVPSRETRERPSSCCPALLLDGTELSNYGAKIYKMKDGLIGSALDLIMKSGSTLLANNWAFSSNSSLFMGNWMIWPPYLQGDVAVGTQGGDHTVETFLAVVLGPALLEEMIEYPGPLGSCRRSSSDAAYEPAETKAKAQRECRLRPHYSDPMPADAAKRKQLELKMAAARRQLCVATLSPGGRNGPAAWGHRWSTVSSLSADSGVRPSAALRAWEARQPCPDCGLRDGERPGEPMCERCSKLRTERKEAILEFLSTEMSYGEDLRIIREEFYCPMQSAGLLTTEQLAVVFANVQELIDVNERFTEQLQDSIDQGDEDLLTVGIGEIFLEFVNMLPAFQTYCLQQSTSVNMLNALEKEKELLRIFLDVSQNDNTALRRMNLRSFLMAPLQRVTKYPLLLSRIGKASAECHPDHGRLREAKQRVESHLEHINMKTKQEGAGMAWSLRSFRRDSRKNREVINIEMREVSMRTVGWPRERTRFVMEGPLQLSQPADGQWVKKGSKALKFQNVQSLLMVKTQRAGESPTQGPEEPEAIPRAGDQWPPVGGECIRDGVLVLIKDKSSGKFAVLREPIRLGNCVVSTDPECEDTFEVLDIRRESFVFRASDKSRTQQWFRQIKRYARDLGPWRKRRNALPNIMINTNQIRS